MTILRNGTNEVNRNAELVDWRFIKANRAKCPTENYVHPAELCCSRFSRNISKTEKPRRKAKAETVKIVVPETSLLLES